MKHRQISSSMPAQEAVESLRFLRFLLFHGLGQASRLPRQGDPDTAEAGETPALLWQTLWRAQLGRRCRPRAPLQRTE